ncbi:MAG: hypothetical protein JWN68_2849 [Nocardioides sp.]|uniref:DUF6912 family protein n=1 Tax=Nocardioides sp. TaxID=35761 RepID=UPI002613E52B|nr:hypothetical protein [Nocardioides sp.]MCW2834896.1 hypothetical protein [Nocardioides sp.]
MRVYLPLTFQRLADVAAAGSVPADVEKFVAEDESEEAEYAALMTAADASAQLSSGSERRVVLAADVVEMEGGVPRTMWASVHVDLDDDPDPDDDLAWYASQEITDLLAGR